MTATVWGQGLPQVFDVLPIYLPIYPLLGKHYIELNCVLHKPIISNYGNKFFAENRFRVFSKDLVDNFV